MPARGKWILGNVVTGYLLDAWAFLGGTIRATRRIEDDKFSRKILILETKIRPEWFRSTFEFCIVEELFLAQWTPQQLSFLPKVENYLYLPISIVHTIGKVLLQNRLFPFTELVGGLPSEFS